MGSLFLRPRRRNIVWLSTGLVAGVLAQVILGAVVVLTGLNPFANMGHFLVSMVLLMNALILYRTALPETVERGGTNTSVKQIVFVRRLVGAIFFLGAASVVTGTVVTATGPHAGDEDAIRFGFTITSVARVHSVTVLLTIASIAALLVAVRRNTSFRQLIEGKVGVLLGFALLQALIGYVQYFNGIPVFLVAFHLAGAAAVWLCLVDLVISARSRL
jgi:cytochrome c oxidase assembly protein subunit 15